MLYSKITENSIVDIGAINVILNGYITSMGIEAHVAGLKEYLKINNIPVKVSNPIYSVFIEQTNNVLMYSEDYDYDYDEAEMPKGHFLFGEDHSTFILQSINSVKNINIDLIKKKIDHLNNLNKKEMRQYYKECIKSENSNPNSKGAGLGLIDIAKHSDTPIEYLFNPHINNLSFFTMMIKIKKVVGERA